MINRILYTLILIAAFASARAATTTYTDSSYKFTLNIPEGWKAETKGEGEFCFTGSDSYIYIYAYRAAKGAHYSFKSTLEQIDSLRPPETKHAILDYPPFYNLLRSKITAVYQLKDGTSIKKIIWMRYNSLFIATSANFGGNDEECNEALASFDIHQTHIGNFHRMSDNLGWLFGSIFLTLIPTTAIFTSRYYNNRQKRPNLVLSAAVSILLIGTPLICLQDDVTLALIISGCSLMIWIGIFRNSKIVSWCYNTLFG